MDPGFAVENCILSLSYDSTSDNYIQLPCWVMFGGKKQKSVAKHRETQLAEAAPECVHLLAVAWESISG